jgi:hypothetical protein
MHIYAIRNTMLSSRPASIVSSRMDMEGVYAYAQTATRTGVPFPTVVVEVENLLEETANGKWVAVEHYGKV